MGNNLKLARLLGGLIVAVVLFNTTDAGGINDSITIYAGGQADGASTVNGSIRVGSGATVKGSLETVNGTIRVDENAVIRQAETVNGSIKVAPGVRAEDLASVNGAILIGADVTIEGQVSVVNGGIAVGTGSKITKDVSNVNGETTISGAEIGEGLSTVNGDVRLDQGVILHGNLTIEKPAGRIASPGRKPRVVIGPGSRVVGRIVAEREVELFISDSAEVGGVAGVMTLEQAVRFGGKAP